MLAFILLFAGVAGGFWSFIHKRKKNNSYTMSAGAAWLLYSVLGLAAAFGAFLVPNVLPYNHTESKSFRLVPVVKLIPSDSTKYYVLENYTPEGRPVHSWIADIEGETVLRSDFSLGAASVVPSKDGKARITYITQSASYPLISPFAVTNPLPSATLSVPDGAIYSNFHLGNQG